MRRQRHRRMSAVQRHVTSCNESPRPYADLTRVKCDRQSPPIVGLSAGLASMIDLRRSSPFIELAAVEAWDAWFRWREQGDLRDLSIEGTWRRVAVALASVEAQGEIATWQSRFMQTFATWRLLPDEQVLANAGTGRPVFRGDTLHAALKDRKSVV